jgi:hypothetical protein
VSLDHERIEQLLAGYVLLALSGEDAIEADRLLSEHVPTCPMCRETLAGFQAVAGELSLAAPPARVPDLVLPRIRRGMDDHQPTRRRGAAVVAVAAGVVALVGMAGLSLTMTGRLNRAEEIRGRAIRFVSALSEPGTSQVSLPPTSSSASDMVEVSGPTLQRMYLFGHGVPAPAPGHAYQLWLGSDGVYTRVGPPFVPEDGIVLLELPADTSRYDEIWITEESLAQVPTDPNESSPHSWRSMLDATSTTAA